MPKHSLWIPISDELKSCFGLVAQDQNLAAVEVLTHGALGLSRKNTKKTGHADRLLSECIKCLCSRRPFNHFAYVGIKSMCFTFVFFGKRMVL